MPDVYIYIYFLKNLEIRYKEWLTWPRSFTLVATKKEENKNDTKSCG